jgi:hypothetical protein
MSTFFTPRVIYTVDDSGRRIRGDYKEMVEQDWLVV